MDSDPSFSCDQCPRLFKTNKYLVKHILNVHSGIKHPCTLCPKSLKSKQTLHNHMKTQHEANPILEDKPPTNKEDKSGDQITQSLVHPSKISEKLTDCVENGSTFDIKKEDNKSNAKPNKIPEKMPVLLEKGKPSDIKIEPKVNDKAKNEETTSATDENPYKCHVCERSYKLAGSLKEHAEIHDNIKYKCKICYKITVKKRNMHSHLRDKHGKEHPYHEFYDIDKEEKSLERDISIKVKQKMKKQGLNKINEKKSDAPIIQNPHEIMDVKDSIKIKADKKETEKVKYIIASCFASDCQSNHEDSLAKQFSKTDENVAIESELESQESCVWIAVQDKIFEDEESDVTESKDQDRCIKNEGTDLTEAPVQIENSLDTNVLIESSSKQPIYSSSEIPNLNQYPGISISKADAADHIEKIDLPQTATSDVPNTRMEEFICETTGCKKTFTAKADLEEHAKAPEREGQNGTFAMLRCILCMTNFENENCLKYHKEKNCGDDDDDDDSEFDSEEDVEDDFDEDQEEGDDDFDEDQEEEEIENDLDVKETDDLKLPMKVEDHPNLDQEKIRNGIKKDKEKLEDNKKVKDVKNKTAQPPQIPQKNATVQPPQIPQKSSLKTNVNVKSVDKESLNANKAVEQNQTAGLIKTEIREQGGNTSTKNALLKPPKEKPLSLVQKQKLYRFEQQAKVMGLPSTVEAIIRMSQANFSNISLRFTKPQIFLCNSIRKEGFKLPSKPTQDNILQQRQNPKQILKRKGEHVDNELLTKKMHLESRAGKDQQETEQEQNQETEDPKPKLLKLQQSVLKGLNLGKNKENYEIIIEDGKVKLKILSDNKEKPTDDLNVDNDNKDFTQDDPKWKNYTDCKKDGSFSNGGPTVKEGWKMCFVEQDLDGRKVMVAKYMSPDGTFYNRGQNGYEVPDLIKG